MMPRWTVRIIYLVYTPESLTSYLRCYRSSAISRLAGFEELNQLRVLGLMDVTTTLAANIPDDTEDGRVRTSVTLVYEPMT
jgi:hypothetical protein